MQIESQNPPSQTPPSQFRLPNGLIGIGELKEFEILAAPESKPLFIMRALEPQPITFVVMEPHDVIVGYQFTISDEDAAELDLTPGGEAPAILNIVTVESLDPQVVTVNLTAPILVNRKTGLGKQVVIENFDKYSTKHTLLGDTKTILDVIG